MVCNFDLSLEQLEAFVNDSLKEDLGYLEQRLNLVNSDMSDFIELKNTVQTLLAELPDGFKTQMPIGGNIFMTAKVDNPKTILIDVGKAYFVEFSLEEAVKFADFKLQILGKEADFLREESIKKRAEIKLTLLYIGEREKLNEQLEGD